MTIYILLDKEVNTFHFAGDVHSPVHQYVLQHHALFVYIVHGCDIDALKINILAIH